MKIVLVLIVLAVLGGGVWYFAKGRPGSTLSSVGTGTSKNEEFSGTLAQAMKLGVPMKCEWKTNEGSGESYVKGEDMYVKTMMSGRNGFMIKKGDCIHTWEEGKNQGVKFCQEDLPEASGEPTDWTPDAGSYKAEGVDWSVEYKCRPDIFGADKFNLPANVQFTDMAEMMKGFTVPAPEQ